MKWTKTALKYHKNYNNFDKKYDDANKATKKHQKQQQRQYFYDSNYNNNNNIDKN